MPAAGDTLPALWASSAPARAAGVGHGSPQVPSLKLGGLSQLTHAQLCSFLHRVLLWKTFSLSVFTGNCLGTLFEGYVQHYEGEPY